MNANEFVGTLFLARDMAHSIHLNTRSYAKHMALNGFYNDIVDAADKFAEMYQGRHGLIGPIKRVTVSRSSDITTFLQSSMESLEGARYDVCEKTDTPIQNVIDEIIGLYLSTLYKLRFLA